MVHLSPRLLIAAAGTLVGLGAHPLHHAPGGVIEQLRAAQGQGVGCAAASWDVPLIQHCGFWSHFDRERAQSSWPLRGAATAAELAALGTERRMLREDPAAGDVFLQWAPHTGAFVHAGIVTTIIARGGFGSRAPYYDLTAIEGDTDVAGKLGGGMTLRVKRRLSAARGDRFLRWTDLERSDRVGRVVPGAAAGRSA